MMASESRRTRAGRTYSPRRHRGVWPAKPETTPKQLPPNRPLAWPALPEPVRTALPQVVSALPPPYTPPDACASLRLARARPARLVPEWIDRGRFGWIGTNRKRSNAKGPSGTAPRYPRVRQRRREARECLEGTPRSWATTSPSIDLGRYAFSVDRPRACGRSGRCPSASLPERRYFIFCKRNAADAQSSPWRAGVDQFQVAANVGQ